MESFKANIFGTACNVIAQSSVEGTVIESLPGYSTSVYRSLLAGDKISTRREATFKVVKEYGDKVSLIRLIPGSYTERWRQDNASLNKVFSIAYYKKLLESFEENGFAWQCQAQRTDFDLCLKKNFKLIRLEPMMHYLHYCKRWPSRFYEKIFFSKVNYVNRVSERKQNKARKQLIKYSNRFNWLNRLNAVDSRRVKYEIFVDEDEDAYVPKVSVKKPERDEDWYNPQGFSTFEEKVKKRNTFLWTKLRLAILEFQELRKKISLRGIRSKAHALENIFVHESFEDFNDLEMIPIYNPCSVESGEEVVPHMEAPGEEQTADKSSNVTLTNESAIEIENPIDSVVNDFWSKASTSDVLANDERTADRWNLLSNFVWAKENSEHQILYTASLPSKFVTLNKNSPNSMMFMQNAYWKGDIHLKVHLNTNIFQVGQLIVYWYYSADFDAKKISRNNRFSAYQLPHALISASESNDVEFVIPYRSYKSLLSTVSRSIDSNPLHMGTFVVMVNNPLKLAPSTLSRIEGVIYIKFPNSQFTGLIPRSFAQPQMMAIKRVVNIASDSLDMLLPEPNRDDPPIVGPPSWCVLQSSQNWSTGNMDAENVQMLRLNPTGQTPHASGSTVGYDEMSFDFMKRQWGFLKTVDWTKDDTYDTSLTMIEAHPCFEFTSFPTNPRVAAERIAPPVSHLANLNCYWRGELEYRFDFVSSQIQTGSLIVAYVPRNVSAGLRLSDLKDCYHALIDLSTTKTFVFKVPYIADKPWWPKREKFDDGLKTAVDVPGMLHVRVLNRLALNASVPDSVSVNILMRGGESFEVSVPVMPSFNPVLDPSTSPGPPPNHCVYTNDGSRNGIVVGSVGGRAAGKALFKLQDLNSSEMQFEGMLSMDYTLLEIFSFAGSPTLIKFNSGTTPVVAQYFVLFAYSPDKPINVIAPFTTKEKAQAFADSRPHPWYKPVSYNLLEDCGADFPVSILNPAPKLFFKISGAPDPQIETETTIDLATGTLQSTLAGRMTFGERFLDLKDYCRRYQLYAIHQITTTEGSPQDMLNCHLSIPITPIGLELGENVSATKVAKGGVIPYILSAYRFYRGSLRFRMIITCTTKVTVFVQHRPDNLIANRLKRSSKEIDINQVLNSGYAMAVVQSDVNPITTFEVPFYNPANLGLLQAPDFTKTSETQHFGMGDLYFSVFGAERSNVTISLFYCIGDDFRASCFVGFPPCVAVATPKAVRVEEDPFVFLQQPTTSLKKPSGDRETIQPQMFSGFFNRQKDKVKTKVRDVIIDEIKEGLNDGNEDIKNGLFEFLTNYIKEFADEKKNDILNAFTHVLQFIINPKLPTFCLSTAGFLATLGIFPFSSILTISQQLEKITTRTFTQTKETEGVTTARPEAEFDAFSIEEKSAFLSTLVSGVCSSLRVAFSWNRIKKMPDFTGQLFTDLKDFSVTANSLCQFFKNNMIMMQKIVHWVSRKFSTNDHLKVMIAEEGDMFEKWYEDCQEVLDPANEEKLKTNSALIMKAYSCAVLAQAIQKKYIMSETLDAKFLKAKFATLNLCKDIMKKREQLVMNKLSPPARFEPFVICQAGSPGIGKSFIESLISSELLKAIDFKTEGEITFTRTPGNQYWNGCKGQPVCVYDDFLMIEDAPNGLQDISELMLLKSTAVFNPPQASIEDKFVRYNPLIVFLNMNKRWPAIDGLADEKAWMRRRDELVLVEMVEKHEGKIAKQLLRSEMEDFKHLQFTIYKYADQRGSEEYLKENLTLKQYIAYLKTSFTNYYKTETEKYMQRLKRVSDFSYDVADGLEDIMMDYTKYLNRLNKSWADPKSKLEQINFTKDVVKKIESTTDEKMKKALLDTIESTHDCKEDFLGIVGRFARSDKASCSKMETGTNVSRKIALRKQLEQIDVKEEEPCSISLENDMIKTAKLLQQRAKNASTKYVNNERKYDPSLNPFEEKKDEEKIRKTTVDDLLSMKVSTEMALNDLKRMEVECREKLNETTPHIAELAALRASPQMECIRFQSEMQKIEDEERKRLKRSSCPHLKFEREMNYARDVHAFVESVWSRNDIITLKPIMKTQKGGFFLSTEIDEEKEDFAFVPEELCDDKESCLWHAHDGALHARAMARWKTEFYESFLVLPEEQKPLYFSDKILVGTFGMSKKKPSKIRELFSADNIKHCAATVFTATARFVLAVLKTVIKVIGIMILVKLAMWGLCTAAPDLMAAADAPAVEVTMKTLRKAEGLIPKSAGEMSYEESVPKAFRRASPVKIVAPAKPQMATEQENVILNKLKRNTFWIVTIDKQTDNMKRMRCLGLKGHYFLMLDHYHHVNVLDRESVRFFFVNKCCRIPFNYDELKFKALENSAIVIGELPPYVEMFKDLTNLFMTQQQSMTIPTKGFLYEISLSEKINTDLEIIKHTETLKVRERLEVSPMVDGLGFTSVDTVICYSQSRQGLCGSVLVADLNTPNPILGIHIAGTKSGTAGFAEVLLQESITQICRSELVLGEDVIPHSLPVEAAKMQIYSQVDPLMVVPKRLAHKSPGKSKLRHSECYEAFYPSTFDKPVLHKNDPRIADNPFSPIGVGCSYHGFVPDPFPDSIFLPAVEDFRSLILGNVRPARTRIGVMTEEEAICGIPIPGYEAMEFNTSEGFPFISERPKGAMNKKWLFDLDETNERLKLKGIHPILRAQLDEKQSSRERGEVPLTVFVNCLKDQKLPKEKVLKPGKTRIFGIAPVDYSIQARQYFLDFLVSYQNARLDAEHAIGINKDSMEWTQLVRELLHMSHCIVTGDYSKFGPTLMSKCVWEVFKVMIDWYKMHGDKCGMNEKVRKSLAYEHMFARHLMLDLIYRTYCGQPCGTPFTSILNSCVNKLYIRCAYAHTFRPGALQVSDLHTKQRLTMSSFRRNVKLVTYGDDLISAIKAFLIKYFNGKVIGEFLAQYNITFTDASKSEEIVDYSHIHDEAVSFLKSTFIKHPFRNGVYLHKLNERVVKETANWIMQSRNDREMSVQSCQAMMLNAFAFGHDRYMELRSRVIEFWSVRGVEILIPTWHEEDTRMFDESSIYASSLLKKQLLSIIRGESLASDC